MTLPTLSVSPDRAADMEADVLVVAVSSERDGIRVHVPEGVELDAEGLSAIGVTGARDEVVRVPGTGTAARAIALVGVGSAPLDAIVLRYAAGTALRQLRGVGRVAVAVPVASLAELTAVLEGAALGVYSFDAYRRDSLAGQKPRASAVVVLADGATWTTEDADEAVARAIAVAGAVAGTKDLVNTPPLDLYPATFVDAVHQRTAGLPVDVRVWDEEALAADGFGGILGVGQGSTRPPRLVKVAYSPAGATRHLALVGKGITYDTGGISLKLAVPMIGMKYDMTGAATILEVVVAAARLQLPVRLTAWLCIAENMPSGSAIRPDDVLRMRGGTTVEVLNTDAEGRLVMADGIVAASEEHPDAIVDIATLTGAQVVALGERYSAVMGDDALVARLLDAARDQGESMWGMPLPEEMRALVNSDIADIANVKPGNPAGGMLVAGVFLQEFVGRTGDAEGSPRIPWAHIDIAGPSHNKGGGHGFTGKGPTGVAVRTLLALASGFSRA
ncbi:leucyl aminopeptidase [Clavibacter michiganensis]|uniref:Probable cytosol aminopeptidase n=1 Tax=Clavibacter michiganensis TaxID=28447 RepID=A0A2S5VTQ8_9MICO|nr:leucyl aminopeptidase [Clavibacter michiganensis]PPF67765.1 leucyl aminopeptidase [Clavibacter michiganensis]